MDCSRSQGFERHNICGSILAPLLRNPATNPAHPPPCSPPPSTHTSDKLSWKSLTSRKRLSSQFRSIICGSNSPLPYAAPFFPPGGSSTFPLSVSLPQDHMHHLISFESQPPQKNPCDSFTRPSHLNG
ncbi:hypothetical protein CHARACLAT_032263 [Characodon lateralis]|uniref:Uncharacterized protein n=1 Tax=Characodon lateralis TaxID=208331 RepID=A0ABU7EYJ9_9TELE|nr:hypothetical protein [Characodon lateralis]